MQPFRLILIVPLQTQRKFMITGDVFRSRNYTTVANLKIDSSPSRDLLKADII